MTCPNDGNPVHCRGLCRPCYLKQWRAANSDRQRELKRSWRRRNPDAARAASARQRARDPEKARDAVRSYREHNRAQDNAASRARYAADPTPALNDWHKRRALKLGASAPLTASEWRDVLHQFGGRCAYCLQPGKMTVDHVEPLSRGGQHCADNVVPACASCNCRKRDRTLLQCAGLGLGVTRTREETPTPRRTKGKL